MQRTGKAINLIKSCSVVKCLPPTWRLLRISIGLARSVRKTTLPAQLPSSARLPPSGLHPLLLEGLHSDLASWFSFRSTRKVLPKDEETESGRCSDSPKGTARPGGRESSVLGSWASGLPALPVPQHIQEPENLSAPRQNRSPFSK